MSSRTPTVLVETPENHIRIIRLNRPERLNAMNVALMSDLYDALRKVGADNTCRVVILTGAGRGFCSGLDLEDAGITPNIDHLTIPRIAMRAIEHFAHSVPAMRAIPQPIIAAINGPAYGGGFCLTLGADIRIAGESASFNSTGINNGLTSTELGASWLLPRLIGASRSNEILLTGRTVDSQEAERIGLVSRTVSDDALVSEAMDVARRIAALSPHGVAMTKDTCWTNLEIPGFEAAIDLENRNQILLGMTTNLEEAKRARKEKRKPVYQDKPQNWPEEW